MRYGWREKIARPLRAALGTGSYQVKWAALHVNIIRKAVLFEVRMSISQDKRTI